VTLSGHLLIAAFVVELLFTFALCYVMLNVATSKSHPNNSFYGLAIGFTVLTGAIAVGAISGGAFNPAVTLSGATIGLFAWPTLWAYLIAQIIAGAAADSPSSPSTPTTNDPPEDAPMDRHRDCAANGVFGPTRRAEVRWDGHCG
jgi:glycerol uptake facilitator-like aquaporin